MGDVCHEAPLPWQLNLKNTITNWSLDGDDSTRTCFEILHVLEPFQEPTQMLLVTSLVFIERAYHLIFAHTYSNAWSFMECSLSLMEISTTSYKKLSMQKKFKPTFLFILIQLWIEVHINIIPF
jgi:hypothetical protein